MGQTKWDLNDPWQRRQFEREQQEIQEKLEKQQKFKRTMRSIIIGVVSFFLLTILFFSCERIDAGHVGVKVETVTIGMSIKKILNHGEREKSLSRTD